MWERGGSSRRPKLTFKERAHPPDGDRGEGGELSVGDLHEEQRHPAQYEENHVRYQEGSCTQSPPKYLFVKNGTSTIVLGWGFFFFFSLPLFFSHVSHPVSPLGLNYF